MHVDREVTCSASHPARILPAGGALVLVAPHALHPLLAEVEARYGGGMATEWLQDEPDVWQVRLSRQPVTV